MPAPKRISDVAVREALASWRGDVSAAARSVGISRNSYRKRLELLGIDPSAARRAAVAPPPSPGSLPATRQRAPVRVLPAHEVQLREGKYDLMAHLRVDIDESAVLAAFISEAFPAWLAGKLAVKA